MKAPPQSIIRILYSVCRRGVDLAEALSALPTRDAERAMMLLKKLKLLRQRGSKVTLKPEACRIYDLYLVCLATSSPEIAMRISTPYEKMNECIKIALIRFLANV